MLELFATAPKGLEGLLRSELESLGAERVKGRPAGVEFHGSLELAYRVCLWSRIASRVLLLLARFPAATTQELYDGTQSVSWGEHLGIDDTLSVGFTTRQSQIEHTHFGALKVKDAIVDQFRAREGARPSVAKRNPDVRINVHVERDVAAVSIDLSGDSLHKRGYRLETAPAPLKENLAAGLLLLSKWPERAAEGAPLVDPMCGSGTIVLEAALMSADSAPGLQRPYYGFLRWRGHDAKLWSTLLADAEQRRIIGMQSLGAFAGFDTDKRALASARANAARAGLENYVTFVERDVRDCAPPADSATNGLVITNPPYGERLARGSALSDLYKSLVDTLRERFKGWRASVILGTEHGASSQLPLRVTRRYTVYNGPLKCHLLVCDIWQQTTLGGAAKHTPKPRERTARETGQANMFANRLAKNLRALKRWRKRQDIDCFRLYDADMPEFALAIDVYNGERLWVHAQEYEAPPTISRKDANARLAIALDVIGETLQVPREDIFLKTRRPHSPSTQYQVLDTTQEMFAVREAGCTLLVNLRDRLDTGLFLDTRSVRARIRVSAAGKRFLNLFAYTGSATVQAIAGNATSSLSVDASNAYVGWGRRNLALNGADSKIHQYLRADCIDWLNDTRNPDAADVFDLIYLDPPTFSNSKRSANTFDVQVDHASLLKSAMRRLAPGGTLIFCNHARRFRLDEELKTRFAIENITAQTIPIDFSRRRNIHNCWQVSHA